MGANKKQEGREYSPNWGGARSNSGGFRKGSGRKPLCEGGRQKPVYIRWKNKISCMQCCKLSYFSFQLQPLSGKPQGKAHKLKRTARQ